jgi:hypothetical protein
VSNHQIPAIIQHILHRTLEVRTVHLGGQQVATPSIVAAATERITDTSAVLAGNKNPQWFP